MTVSRRIAGDNQTKFLTEMSLIRALSWPLITVPSIAPLPACCEELGCDSATCCYQDSIPTTQANGKAQGNKTVNGAINNNNASSSIIVLNGNGNSVSAIKNNPTNNNLKSNGTICENGTTKKILTTSPTFQQLITTRRLLCRHYYPEGGWGIVIVIVACIVQTITHGLHLCFGILLLPLARKFHAHWTDSSWVGALSTGIALGISPITVALCKRKSTRVTAVIGGLVTALGCLFTSFASQFHQLFFSYAVVMGIGVGMTRDCSTLMVAQYFKRRREFVEIFIASGSGFGIALMSAFIKSTINSIGWRLGLQAVTGLVFLTFILGTFYRSASLYHPQRRAILHLKNQRRKIKDKNKQDDSPPFFDFKTLKSKTVRILLISTGICAFGINTPIFYMAYQVERDGLGEKVLQLQMHLGMAWVLGCAAFGMLVVRNSVECRIARQYLCQTSALMCGVSTIAFTAVQGNFHGYVLFVWIYGIFCGGYHYSLKMYTYERVRARNFARTWGFVQCSQSLPIIIGVPIAGYMNLNGVGKEGYYFSSICSILGCFVLFFVDLHRRNLNRHKHLRANGTRQLCTSETCPQRRKLSFTQDPDNEPGLIVTGTTLMIGSELFIPQANEKILSALEPNLNGIEKPELTCISEEGIADMDLPDNLLDDLDYVGDCITSCNKVENYLMLSEFENNLNAEQLPVTPKAQSAPFFMVERKRRKLSMMNNHQKINEESDEEHHAGLGKENLSDSGGTEKDRDFDDDSPSNETISSSHKISLWPRSATNKKNLLVNAPSSGKRNNLISVMDEASV